MKIRTTQLAIHILCSTAFLLFPILSSPGFPDLNSVFSSPNGIREISTHALLLLFFYGNYYYLIPKFYFRQKYFAFYSLVLASLLVIFLVLSVVISAFPRHMVRGPVLHQVSKDIPARSTFMRPRHHNNLLRIFIFNYSFYLFLIVFFASLLLKTNQRWRKLRQEKLQTELSYLKAQINPHFLFNTLNSIYALAIEKSDYTATAVVKLSGMMRYIISESNRNFVSLEKEIAYISDYIELQHFRLQETVRIDYLLKGSVAAKEIAPLILITFVENAFKYGVNPEEDSAIFVRILIEKEELSLHVENNKVNTGNAATTASGLGITNTRNRLEMLYPGKHNLAISDQADKFIVRLQVDLS